MQWRGGINPIFAGSKNDEVSAGIQRHGRKGPFVQIRGIIGEMITAERDRRTIRIVDFDPIGILAILVLQTCFIIRHELGNARRAQDRQDGRQKKQQDTAP